VGSKTLFATHYHELTALAASHARVRNMSVAAREWQGEVIFLRKLTPGGASRSFGVEVAKLAGLPPSVVERARAILRTLESDASAPGAEVPHPVAPESAAPPPQLGLAFGAPTAASVANADAPTAEAGAVAEIVEALRAVDPDDLSPRAALDLVARLAGKLGKKLDKKPGPS
jgi:DNA mismatch repair protein MutS